MQWSQSGIRSKTHQMFLDSEDDRCEVRDENEESCQLSAALSLFL